MNSAFKIIFIENGQAGFTWLHLGWGTSNIRFQFHTQLDIYQRDALDVNVTND